MGGKLWIESTVGKGTTIHFTAPFAVQRGSLRGTGPADESQLQDVPVLVVDDNAVNRRILRQILLTWRMQPTVVASGPAAMVEMLAAARAGAPFPLVILDGMMPEMDGFAVLEKMREHAELSGATVMMLPSAMPGGTAARCVTLGVASYLMKPVSQVELLDAILIALGKVTDFRSDSAPEAPTESGMRILLAEDNAINRALAKGIFERRGHVLTHAATGREAVSAFERGLFDVVFMDVQMPEMDGLEATGRIRALEQTKGGHRTPIVAMTAHAMAGDRERCLAAGMDDYIAKPLQKAELLALLKRISKGTEIQYSPIPVTSSERADDLRSSTFDRATLLDQFDGDEHLLQRMVAIFHTNTPRMLAELRDSIVRRSSEDVARTAHTLLSSMGAFGAQDALHLTRQLETRARQNDYESIDRTFAALERETAKLYLSLSSFTPVQT
jgi:CheY-like chemotaxis protein